MKKKVLVAMALATAMAAMPVVAGAAGSAHYSSDSDGSDYSSSSSGKTTSTDGQSELGSSVVSNNPSVQVTDTGAKVDVASTTRDSQGTVVGLVGTAAGNGAVTVDGVTVNIATGAAETAGLPTGVVDTIKALNGSASVSELLPGLGMEGYAKVGGTRAVVAKNAANADAAVNVTLYVSTLPADAKEVSVVYYNNMTGQWNVIKNISADLAKKTVSFQVPASCTIQVVVK